MFDIIHTNNDNTAFKAGTMIKPLSLKTILILRVQNEQFSEERFILHDTEKEVQFLPGFKLSIHGLQGELSTAELSDLLMNGHKSSLYQVLNTLLTNQ